MALHDTKPAEIQHIIEAAMEHVLPGTPPCEVIVTNGNGVTITFQPQKGAADITNRLADETLLAINRSGYARKEENGGNPTIVFTGEANTVLGCLRKEEFRTQVSMLLTRDRVNWRQQG